MNLRLKSLFALLISIIAIIGFFWLANFLGSGEKAQSEKPLVICEPRNAPPETQTCFWTAHVHAMVKVFKGSPETAVGFEQGVLEGEHTHAEKNKLHWHGLIPVDSKTKEVKDWSPLMVSNIQKDLKLSIDGAPKFIANGKDVESSYIWQDGDTIEIRYE